MPEQCSPSGKYYSCTEFIQHSRIFNFKHGRIDDLLHPGLNDIGQASERYLLGFPAADSGNGDYFIFLRKITQGRTEGYFEGLSLPAEYGTSLL